MSYEPVRKCTTLSILKSYGKSPIIALLKNSPIVAYSAILMRCATIRGVYDVQQFSVYPTELPKAVYVSLRKTLFSALYSYLPNSTNIVRLSR